MASLFRTPPHFFHMKIHLLCFPAPLCILNTVMHLQSGGLKQVKTFDFLRCGINLLLSTSMSYEPWKKKNLCKHVKVFKPVFPCLYFFSWVNYTFITAVNRNRKPERNLWLYMIHNGIYLSGIWKHSMQITVISSQNINFALLALPHCRKRNMIS